MINSYAHHGPLAALLVALPVSVGIWSIVTLAAVALF